MGNWKPLHDHYTKGVRMGERHAMIGMILIVLNLFCMLLIGIAFQDNPAIAITFILINGIGLMFSIWMAFAAIPTIVENKSKLRRLEWHVKYGFPLEEVTRND